MPVRRLYRPERIRWLQLFRRREDEKRRKVGKRPMSYCQYCIAAYLELNPDFDATVKHNTSSLEFEAGYADEDLLMDNGRGQLVPDRNIIYYFERTRLVWNKTDANKLAQLRALEFDFSELVTNKRNPEGVAVRFSHRFLRPVRGPDDVDLAQRDLDNVTEGIDASRERLEECRNEQEVDITLREVLSR